MRRETFGIAAALTVAASAALGAGSPNVQAIVDASSAAAYYQGADGRATVHMSIVDGDGRERTRDFTILRHDIDDADNGEQRFYVYFQRPADVNRTVFMVWKHVATDDDRWLYLPALDLVKRIAASDERTSFVGSHFFYEDVSGRGTTEDSHVLVEETDLYYVVESTPKTPRTVEFTAYRSHIHKDSKIPVQIEYFDRNGEPYRTYTATKVETVDGWPTVVEATIADSRMGGATTLSYSAVAYDVKLPPDIFSERYLRSPPRSHLR